MDTETKHTTNHERTKPSREGKKNLLQEYKQNTANAYRNNRYHQNRYGFHPDTNKLQSICKQNH